MTKDQLARLTEALSIEELTDKEVAVVKDIIREQAKEGRVDNFMTGIANAILADDDILEAIHYFRAYACRFVPVSCNWYSQAYIDNKIKSLEV